MTYIHDRSEVCPNCGGTLIGDGYTMVVHCENVDLDLENQPEPDSSPVYCDE
jgi:uncharacterized protein (DUF983 family)